MSWNRSRGTATSATANGGRPVAQFTPDQIAKGVMHTAQKTSYLTWQFEGASRAWFDPTYPHAASNLIHRRFDDDWQTWQSLLGDEAVMHEYRKQYGDPPHCRSVPSRRLGAPFVEKGHRLRSFHVAGLDPGHGETIACDHRADRVLTRRASAFGDLSRAK